MKKLFTLFAAGALFATGAFAQLTTPFQVDPDDPNAIWYL